MITFKKGTNWDWKDNIVGGDVMLVCSCCSHIHKLETGITVKEVAADEEKGIPAGRYGITTEFVLCPVDRGALPDGGNSGKGTYCRFKGFISLADYDGEARAKLEPEPEPEEAPAEA